LRSRKRAVKPRESARRESTSAVSEDLSLREKPHTHLIEKVVADENMEKVLEEIEKEKIANALGIDDMRVGELRG